VTVEPVPLIVTAFELPDKVSEAPDSTVAVPLASVAMAPVPIPSSVSPVLLVVTVEAPFSTMARPLPVSATTPVSNTFSRRSRK
jgi:hypothetical protein